MLGWMLYAIVVSALLGAAAWTAERSAQTRRAPARLYWSLAIVASLLLPIAIVTVTIQPPSLYGAVGSATPVMPIPLRQMTSVALAPAQWLERVPVTPQLPNPDGLLAVAWAAVSGALVIGIVVNGLLLQRSKAGWTTARVAGVEVFVSETVGPAVVGLLRPRIVVPRWISTASPESQALIIAHERTHLDADDARLLAVAILLTICMPWNLPLWWQLRRLRLAIEVDCDARVLRGGGDMGRYGETLLMVGARHSSNLAVVAAMSEPRSNLEQRLRRMLSRPAKFAWASGAALAGVSLVLAASAAEISPPNREVAPQDRKPDAAMLDRYVGLYDVDHLAILNVTRVGTELWFQVTGSAASPAAPRAPDEFSWRGGAIRFAAGPDGRAASATGRHNGTVDYVAPRMTQAAAAKFNSDLLARIESAQPEPGSQAALTQVVPGLLAGAPDYDRMTPGLAREVRRQLPQSRRLTDPLGPVERITFSGVGPAGNDIYIVRHAHGASRWTINLDQHGKIRGLTMAGWP